MTYTLHIKRQKNAKSQPYWQDFPLDGASPDWSVAAALQSLQVLPDPVAWQCSCLVRKCGACAMRINGRPRLACAAFLRDLGTRITLEPLSKFPLIRDLIVDRSLIHKGLKDMQLWHSEPASYIFWTHAIEYQSSRCLLCGCCLEVCPAFTGTDRFLGAVAPVNASRIIAHEARTPHGKDLRQACRRHYEDICAHSLACQDICPAHLPVTELLAYCNKKTR